MRLAKIVSSLVRSRKAMLSAIEHPLYEVVRSLLITSFSVQSVLKIDTILVVDTSPSVKHLLKGGEGSKGM
jgi:hypothetical protein